MYSDPDPNDSLSESPQSPDEVSDRGVSESPAPDHGSGPRRHVRPVGITVSGVVVDSGGCRATKGVRSPGTLAPVGNRSRVKARVSRPVDHNHVSGPLGGRSESGRTVLHPTEGRLFGSRTYVSPNLE